MLRSCLLGLRNGVRPSRPKCNISVLQATPMFPVLSAFCQLELATPSKQSRGRGEIHIHRAGAVRTQLCSVTSAYNVTSEWKPLFITHDSSLFRHLFGG